MSYIEREILVNKDLLLYRQANIKDKIDHDTIIKFEKNLLLAA